MEQRLNSYTQKEHTFYRKVWFQDYYSLHEKLEENVEFFKVLSILGYVD
jgi:hypothetical protein